MNVIDGRQDARQAVATARDERDISATGSSTMEGRQPHLVVASKALIFSQRRFVNFNLMTQKLEPFDATFETGLVTHCT